MRSLIVLMKEQLQQKHARTEKFTSHYDEFGSRATKYLIGLCTNAPGVSSIICPGCSAVAHVIQLLHNTDWEEKELHLKQQRSPTVAMTSIIKVQPKHSQMASPTYIFQTEFISA